MEKIPIKETEWNLSELFSSDNDPNIEKERKQVEQACLNFSKKWKSKDYLKDPKILLEALNEYEELHRKYGTDGKEEYYFYLRSKQDQTDPKIKAKYNNIKESSTKMSNELQFFSLRLAKIPEKTQKIFLQDKELKKYHHYLKRLFDEAKHLLTEDQEKIMNLKSETSYAQWVRMTSSFLSKEECEVLSEDGKKSKEPFPKLLSLISSQKKEVRDKAAEAVNHVLKKHSDVAEAELNAILQNKKINDELRKIPRPDYTRHLADDIETEVVDAMTDAVSSRFDIAKRYYQLMAKLLNLPHLEYHERLVPYGNMDKHSSYEDSVQLVHKVINNLDNKFGEIFKKFVTNGQIDVYPRKGKKEGAFCIQYLLTQPTYIMLNHTDKLRDVLTIAHETGHGINNELVKEKQHSLYNDTPLSTAEVASTFMEDFVLQEIMKEADDELKLSILMKRLNDDVSTISRQVACYLFEKELHKEFREKKYLSKEEIGKIFQKNMISYMGPAVEQSPGSENWWVYWQHIREFFYVYSYASGLLISKAMQSAVKKDPKFIEKVKEFLAAGTSESPKETFKKMNIDITKKEFWLNGLDEIDQLLKETEELAKKLGKI